MNENIKEKRERFIFRLSAVVSVLASIVVFLLVGLQVYIRWFINQNFTVLGGNELEVLTISVFALIVSMAYAYRPR